MTTIKQHLKERYMDTNLHTVWVSEENRCATFPLWNLSGQMVGYQRYQPDEDKLMHNDPTTGRYFTRCGSKDVGTYGKEQWSRGPVGMWGLESWNLSNTLFITEGIFDACRITYYGYSAMAVLSYALSDSQRNWVWTIRQTRPVVCVCDNDSSGRKLGRFGHSMVTVDGHDLGDASEDYVKELVSEYG